jgi:hypothetical protein
MSKLVVIVPSRGRPSNARRLWNAWRDTDAKAELQVIVDDDDPTRFEYEAESNEAGVGRLVTIKRKGLVGTLNHIANTVSGAFEHIGFMGDDHLPRTSNWDRHVTDALDEMRTGIAYGNDLHQGSALPTAVFMTSNIVKTLGYMAPPQFKHMYVDNVWRDWGQGISRLRYLEDVVIEHMHPDAGKAIRDSGYACTTPFMGEDSVHYNDYVATTLAKDIATLRRLR